MLKLIMAQQAAPMRKREAAQQADLRLLSQNGCASLECLSLPAASRRFKRKARCDVMHGISFAASSQSVNLLLVHCSIVDDRQIILHTIERYVKLL
jgi:hypothetical protein